MSGKNWDRVPIDAQSVDAPLSQSAIFLVVTVAGGQPALAKVGSVLGELDDLVKTVGFRDLGGRLSCIAGIGRDLWDRLSPGRRPLELKPFAPIKGAVHSAPSTAGDLLFHIRAERPDMCFEFERILLDRLGPDVTVVDEVTGFRYFDARDLLGFVDGTANPTGLDLPASALVGDEDADFAGGSYVVVQKYLHDMQAWARIPTPEQEAIIGRTKIDNIEIDDDDAPRKSHKSLATIEDADGNEYDNPARQHAVRPARSRTSSAPTSSATAGISGSPKRCCSACMSATRRAPTTGCSMSRRRRPARPSSRRRGPCCRPLSRARSSSFPPHGKRRPTAYIRWDQRASRFACATLPALRCRPSSAGRTSFGARSLATARMPL